MKRTNVAISALLIWTFSLYGVGVIVHHNTARHTVIASATKTTTPTTVTCKPTTTTTTVAASTTTASPKVITRIITRNVPTTTAKASTPTQAAVNPEQLPDSAAKLLGYINVYRGDKGLTLLQENHSLDVIASNWAVNTGQRAVVENNPNLGAQLSAAGVQWSAGGENDGATAGTVDQLFQGWVASPTHYSALVGNWSQAGIGYVKINGRNTAVVVFIR